MAAWTVNSTISNGDWIMLDAYNTDCSTSTELIAEKTGHKLLLKSLTVDINDNDTWFKVFDGTDLEIGPVKPRTNIWHRDFETPFEFSGAMNVQTESDKQIHLTLAYRIARE